METHSYSRQPTHALPLYTPVPSQLACPSRVAKHVGKSPYPYDPSSFPTGSINLSLHVSLKCTALACNVCAELFSWNFSRKSEANEAFKASVTVLRMNLSVYKMDTVKQDTGGFMNRSMFRTRLDCALAFKRRLEDYRHHYGQTHTSIFSATGLSAPELLTLVTDVVDKPLPQQFEVSVTTLIAFCNLFNIPSFGKELTSVILGKKAGFPFVSMGQILVDHWEGRGDRNDLAAHYVDASDLDTAMNGLIRIWSILSRQASNATLLKLLPVSELRQFLETLCFYTTCGLLNTVAQGKF